MRRHEGRKEGKKRTKVSKKKYIMNLIKNMDKMISFSLNIGTKISKENIKIPLKKKRKQKFHRPKKDVISREKKISQGPPLKRNNKGGKRGVSLGVWGQPGSRKPVSCVFLKVCKAP